MRGQESKQGIWGHLLVPAILLLASVALAIPGNLGLEESPLLQVADVAIEREVNELRELADAGACDLVSAVAEAERISTGFVRLMLRLSEALDQVSRDAGAFLDWLEDVMGHDGLDALDVMTEGVAGWFADSLDSPECPGEALAEHDPSPCHA